MHTYHRSNCKGIKDAVENREYVVANGSVLSIENRYRGRYRIIKHAGIGIGRRQIYDSALEPVVAHKIREGAEGLIVIPQIPTAKMQVVVFAVSKHMFICSR